MESALKTSGLGKRYGSTWALRECSLRLPAGRIGALVGPNGAGKTTLLHLAVGLLRPDVGEVRVLGEPPGDPAMLARVGFVAQDTPLYRDFTAADLITMGDRLNRRWDAALARARLNQLRIPLDRRVGKLSGGQRAQVALALAMAKRPQLLLLDEPVASLDPLARRDFLEGLTDSLAGQDITVLLSSHLLADLERVCDYLIVLQDSRVRVFGSVEALLAEHRLLVGPRQTPQASGGVAEVIQGDHRRGESTWLVRINGVIRDPQWTVRELSLEGLVLAYLAGTSHGEPPDVDIELGVLQA